MKPNFSSTNFIGQISITIVVPTEVPDAFFKIISHQSIGLSQSVVFVAPNFDFHPLFSNGFTIQLNQNQEVILFSFKFMDDRCREGIRIFNNDSDLNSNSQGIEGIDFKNSITDILKYVEIYSSNYNNNGTNCTDCKDKRTVPFIVQKNINHN